jgi:hypothetical protein
MNDAQSLIPIVRVSAGVWSVDGQTGMMTFTSPSMS